MTRLRTIAARAALTTAALLASTSAFAQAAASPYTSATRYDVTGRVTGTISADPDGAGGNPFLAVRNTYNAAGQLIRVETGALAVWQSEAVAPASWANFTVFRTVETRYDTMGRKTRETLREGAVGAIRTVTQYSYDLAGRPDCTAVRMNPADFGAPPASACTQGTGGADRITRNVYDAAGQRLQVREGVGTAIEAAEATWAYNRNGQITTVIDANGNRAELSYDGHGRQAFWTFPSPIRAAAYNDATQASALASAGAVNAADYEAYGYDPNGNRTFLRKRDGRGIAFAYDNLNRVTAKIYPQGGATAVYYSYDLRNLQLSARFTSSSGDGITNAYGGFGRLTSSTLLMDGISQSIGSGYDANGNRVRVTQPDGLDFTYTYDGVGRLTGIYQGLGTSIVLAQFTYNPQGLPATRGERYGSSVAYGFDPVGRLTSQADVLVGGVNNVTYGFGRNAADQITSRTRNNDAYAWTGAYTVNRAYTTNGLNQYSAAGTAGFTYDANGNLTSDGTRTFTYDVENRLVGASGGVTLRYDPLGRLYEVSGPSGTKRFVWDGDALVDETNTTGWITDRYVHGAASGADDPLVWYGNTGVNFLHADNQGSVVAITSYGTTPSINAYDEYGIPRAGNVGRFQYTGQIWLPELGMYHYKARIYSPTLGRFLQTDPIGYKDQFNLYAYVGNDPVNASDPSGEETTCNGDRSSCLTLTYGPGPTGGNAISASNVTPANQRTVDAQGNPGLDQAASEVAAILDQHNGNERLYRQDQIAVLGVSIVLTNQVPSISATPNAMSFNLNVLRGAEGALHTEPKNHNTGLPGVADRTIPDRLGIPNYAAYGTRVTAMEQAGGAATIRPVNHTNTNGFSERVRHHQDRLMHDPLED